MMKQKLILICGDMLALFLFVLAGQREHNTLNVGNLLLQTLVFVLVWVGVGWWLKVFSIEAENGWQSFMSRSLNAWLVSAPLSLLLRAFLLPRTVIPTAFFMVTLAVGGLFLLGWRLGFALFYHKKTKST